MLRNARNSDARESGHAIQARTSRRSSQSEQDSPRDQKTLCLLIGKVNLTPLLGSLEHTGEAVLEASQDAKAIAKGSTGAESSINQGRLNSQLLVEEVASGHAFQKHVVERQEFADLGIKTKSDFQNFVEKIVSNPVVERRQAADGTVYYLDSSTRTIVIRGRRGEATAFRPDEGGVGWEKYIKTQVPKK